MILASDRHCPLVEMINYSNCPFLIVVEKQRVFDATFKIELFVLDI